MTPSTPTILAIDLGTSGLKVAVVGVNGRILASAARPVPTTFIPPNGAEQDPEHIWSSIEDAVREVLGTPDVDPASICAITTDSQFSSIIPVDANARPLMNMLPWYDGRGGIYSMGIYGEHAEALETWMEVHGIPPIPSGADSLSHMLYIKHERPEIYEKTAAFLEPMDFITARLTGELTTNVCASFLMLLTDNRDVAHADYHDDLLRMAGIARDKLPRLVPRNSSLGTIRKEIANAWGIPPTAKVYSPINDTQAAAVGIGTFRGARGGVNIGTTCQLLAHTTGKKSDMQYQLVSMPSPIGDPYIVMAENGLGGKTLEHFITNIVFASDAFGDHSPDHSFAAVDAVVEAIPPGANGLLYLPWLTGAIAPSANGQVRGGFINMSLDTSRGDMTRAILEGVAYNLFWLLDPVEQFAEVERFDQLCFSGGGALSNVWAQAIADIMDRPVRQMDNPRYLLNRATAFLGFIEEGELSPESIDTFCPVAAEYAPRPEHRATYDHLFEQYKKTYEQLEPVFESLNPEL